MSRIFVSGLSNVETSCAVGGFPIAYQPVDYNFFGIGTVASGVGLNVSLALTALSDDVSFATFAGGDPAGELVRAACRGIADTRLAPCRETPQSVILYDCGGRRRAYTDLKDMQEISLPQRAYADFGRFDAFCLCNINYSRPLLPLAKATGKPIFCDVHCLAAPNDAYNADFMAHADVLFLSNEQIIGREEDFVRRLAALYPCRLFVVGMGEKGALLYERGAGFTYSPAVFTRPVINTVGAGDALFSAFVHFYTAGREPQDALRLACIFASYKIGESGASKGFLGEKELLRLAVSE